MNILLIHQNFPGQYPHLAAALVARGDQVMAIGGPTAREILGVELHRYNPKPDAGVPACDAWATDFQTKVLRGRAVAQVLEGILNGGFCPDIVVGHPGWGELLLVKDLLPGVPVVHHVEFVYQLNGADANFDQEFSHNHWQNRSKLRLKRATQLMAFHDLDWGLAPTQWQASTAPAEFQDKITVIHEGIDTNRIKPRPGCLIQMQKSGQTSGLTFRPGDELVSFVSRNLEPYRGFHVFMRMLPLLQALRPNAHVVIVGGEGVSYGASPRQGGTWKQVMLQELEGQLDLNKVHFAGKVPHGVLHDLFRVSACHVYLTYPFVLSWSLLEAMACESVIVGSSTAPVQEVIRNKETGFLVDFFDTEALARAISDVLANRMDYQRIGAAARKSVEQTFDLHKICLPRQLELIDRVAKGLQPLTTEQSRAQDMSQ